MCEHRELHKGPPGVREHRELRQTMAEDMLEPGRRPEASDRTDKIEGWSLSRDGFVLRPCGRPFMIEVFAGSGRLTRALRRRGFDAWAVDWRGGRLHPETPAILFLNLQATEVRPFRAALRHGVAGSRDPGVLFEAWAPAAAVRGVPSGTT